MSRFCYYNLPHTWPSLNDNERQMILWLILPNKIHITIISDNAATTDEGVKNQFYQQLGNIIVSIPPADKLLLLGDFNATVRKDNFSWENVIGKEGIENCKSNEHLRLCLCTERNLFTMNTHFQLLTCFKTTWMHSRFKPWQLIDYSILRQNRDVLITREDLNINDCWTSHHRVTSHMRITLHKIPRLQHQPSSRRKYDISKLQNSVSETTFESKISQEFISNSVNDELSMKNGGQFAEL